MDNSIIRMPKERSLFFTEQVDQTTISSITKKIVEINDDDELLCQQANLIGFKYEPKPIKLYIDSYGGSIYQCMSLVSVIENSKVPVHTICMGAAMSAGFIILISGHKRFAYKYSTPLYHQASTLLFGTIKTIEEDVAETKRLQKIIEKMTLEKTRISKEKLKEVYEKKLDWYMTAEEALKLSVVDEIL
jgi:ATP-dependent Clp protease protease subunit